MKTTPKTLHISNTGTPEGIYSHQGRGGQGTGPGPKRGRGRDRTAAETLPRPRFRGHTGAARGPVCPLSGPMPGF